METDVFKVPRSPSSTLDDVDCEKTEVDDHDTSHDFVTPSFGKHNIIIGS